MGCILSNDDINIDNKKTLLLTDLYIRSNNYKTTLKTEEKKTRITGINTENSKAAAKFSRHCLGYGEPYVYNKAVKGN